jgi:hypothetical protein
MRLASACPPRCLRLHPARHDLEIEVMPRRTAVARSAEAGRFPELCSVRL